MKKKFVVTLFWIGTIVCVGFVVYQKMVKIQNKIWKLAMKNEKILRLLDYWLESKENTVSVADVIIEHGHRNIAIYGFGLLGERLYNELKDSSVNIRYIIDRNANEKVADVDVIQPEEHVDDVDLVIITAIGDYKEIKESIKNNVNCPIISLEDVVYEL